jgi:phosphoglucomutase
MTASPLAGKPAPKEMLVDVARLEREYFDAPATSEQKPILAKLPPDGHRGGALGR